MKNAFLKSYILGVNWTQFIKIEDGQQRINVIQSRKEHSRAAQHCIDRMRRKDMEERIVGFPPIDPPNARLLILGTMPSVESLHQNFYYAHPRNAFWPIMAAVLGANEMPKTVEEKRTLLVENRIALWDVAHSCVREGSLDSAIRVPQPNDFARLFEKCACIEKILFNGSMAKQLFLKLVGPIPEKYAWALVPSTSPAYTKPMEWKMEIWRREMEMIL